MLRNFGLSVKCGLVEVYRELYRDIDMVHICIPWKGSRLDVPEMYQENMNISSRGVILDTGLRLDPRNTRQLQGVSMGATCVVGQDLSITEEKAVRLNKAIRDLDLTIGTLCSNSILIQRDRGTAGDVGMTEFRTVQTQKFGRLWQPKVLLLLGNTADIEKLP